MPSIDLPDGITSIGDRAFYSCSSLTSIDLPDGITSIGNRAFYSCSSLTSIDLPDGITSIGDATFEGCSSLTSIDLPDGLTSIRYCAFQNCSSLTSIDLPDGVTSIGSSAFTGCSSLTSIALPDELTSIGGEAFSGCSSLTSIDLPEGVNSIGNRAFISCSSLTSIDLPDGLTSIGGQAFSSCSSLTSIDLPDGLTSIGDQAFSSCSSLTSIDLPDGLTSIGSHAFQDCSSLDRIYLQGEKPFTYNSKSYLFDKNRAIIVPESAIDAYCTAVGWSDNDKYITSAERMNKSIEVTASNTGSSVRTAIGDDKVAGVVDLKIKGTINSYDIIVLNQKMPILHNLDLGEAQIVACDYPYYDNNCTADDQLSDCLFQGHPSLRYIILPKEINEEIGRSVFYNCKIRSIVIPNGVTTIGDNAFMNSDLQEIVFPESLVKIGNNAFYYAKLNKVVLPPNLKTIGSSAFSRTPLTEIRLPSSLREIGGKAFDGCGNLKKVYTYTILPLSIADGTFSNAANAELYLPETSSEYYYFAPGWKGFLKHITFNEPYKYFYADKDYTENDNTGYIQGEGGKNPDADINPGGGFIVEGEQGDDETPNQSLGDVNLENDGNGNSGSIMGDNNLWLDNLNIKINVKGGRWYFFAFPFDIKMDRISLENGSAHVWRYYDGEERANGKPTGWKNVNGNKLNAAQGYIFQSSGDDVLVLNIGGLRVKKEDKYNELVAHMSENLKDASWNFMGNPYMSYYDLNDMDYSAPVTVWDGTKYVAIRPGDDDYHFTPFEALFVQKPEGEGSVGFDGDQQMTQTQSKEKKEKQQAARKMLVKQMAGSDNPRKLINLTLNSGEDNDGTRIVFNNAQSTAYETMCDAAKFESQGVIQLFTLGTGNERYAINERPVDNGIVGVGYTAPTAGEYTISAARMDTPVFVKDMKTGALHDLRQGGYTFSTEAGTYAQRIQIWTEGTATGIGRVNAEQATGAEKVYDMSGRATNKEAKGVYIINGEKTLVK